MFAVPVSAHHFTNWLRSVGCIGLARRIGEREGWGRDPWQWTAQQRGECREEIRARLDVNNFTIPRPNCPVGREIEDGSHQ